jgi:pimeloyl-ACP methyl ester carboxylesterase
VTRAMGRDDASGPARSQPRGLLRVGAAIAAGALAGFLAERIIVRRRVEPRGPRPSLGSLAGELDVVDGPDGLRVAIECYGPPDAPQLVLSHGWVCTGRVWHEQVRALADRYRLITYDQPGHGRTSRPGSGSYDLDLLGDTLLRVIEVAARPGPLVLAGHSMGGMSILNAVRRYGELLDARLAGVVLLSTTSHAQPLRRLSFDASIQGWARLDRAVRGVVPRLRDPRLIDLSDRATSATSDLSHLVTRWVSTGPGADPTVTDFTQQMAIDSGADVVIGLAEAILGVDEDAALDHLADLDVPTTVIVGSHDRLTPIGLSQRMADRMEGELIVLEAVGHMAPLEAPPEVNAVLRRMLDDAADQPEAASGSTTAAFHSAAVQAAAVADAVAAGEAAAVAGHA